MLLSALRQVAAAYLGVSIADLTVGGTDMFLVAANNVRKEAELQHNFEFSRVTGTLSIDGVTGGSLDDVDFGAGEDILLGSVLLVQTGGGSFEYVYFGTYGGFPLWVFEDNPSGTFIFYSEEDGSFAISQFLGGITVSDKLVLTPASGLDPRGDYNGEGFFNGLIYNVTGDFVNNVTLFSGVKEIVALSRTLNNGVLEPLDFTSSEIGYARDANEIETLTEYDGYERYPSDRAFDRYGGERTLVQRNRRLYIQPNFPTFSGIGSNPLVVSVEAYAFMVDYVAADYSRTLERDFFLSHGHQFLQWGIICELNYLFQKFVPRQEGVISPPEAKKAEAWRNLIIWDDFQVANASTRSR